MAFFCSKCGICCQSVGIIVEKAKQNGSNDPIMQEVAEFPHEYDQSGRCSKLSLDNECTVYQSRPDMCNVEIFHKKHFSHISQSDFFNLNEKECVNLQNSKI